MQVVGLGAGILTYKFPWDGIGAFCSHQPSTKIVVPNAYIPAEYYALWNLDVTQVFTDCLLFHRTCLFKFHHIESTHICFSWYSAIDTSSFWAPHSNSALGATEKNLHLLISLSPHFQSVKMVMMMVRE